MKPGVIHATFGENLIEVLKGIGLVVGCTVGLAALFALAAAIFYGVEYTSKRWGWPGAVFYGIGVVAVIIMAITGVMTIAGSL